MITVVRKTVIRQFGDVTMHDSTECRSKGAIRVKCTDCGWTGYRRPLQCECYEDYAPYCRPWSPGPGCPSGITYRCPRCATTPPAADGQTSDHWRHGERHDHDQAFAPSSYYPARRHRRPRHR